jgi:hypothetical protein
MSDDSHGFVDQQKCTAETPRALRIFWKVQMLRLCGGIKQLCDLCASEVTS